MYKFHEDRSHWPSCCSSKGQDSSEEWLKWNPVVVTPPETASLTHHGESCQASEDGPLNSRAISPWRYELDRDLDRLPQDLYHARCLCPHCVSLQTGSHMDPLGNSELLYHNQTVFYRRRCRGKQGCWWWCGGLCPADPMKMLGARDRPGWPPGEGTAAGLQGFAVDKTFLSSLRGILLETELALTFIIFICFTASISAYMAAPLLEFFITLAFLFLYATQYYKRLDRLNWPCLDFLRCVSAIIIFLVVSFAAVTSRDGAAIAAFVFGIILVSVLAFDAFKIYQTEMAPSATEGDQQ
ncbi:CKLF-like MARVEL transmembrane domain-containing protein 5 isoform X2 [Elephas maximus indicus]|uniref:CKLF-like MARVEL transmembrane domain-containing protein 5 isoform X2 n=1 Tax=Elephas maximus indicus TaxID=99487 RepID=UPI002116B387|nr:CKLF-like MARVEL transmembrane domain-containing protein 5 isoform X2 [Elephas maximus indicus]